MTAREPIESTFFCREHSLAVGEPLLGSAPHLQTVLLLEFTGRWEPDVLDSQGLPDEVRAHLKVLDTTLPAARVWLIRHGKELPLDEQTGMMFYVALIRESHPALYAFRLKEYTDLLALDIPAVVAEAPVYAAQRSTDLLVLVCTHGRRDRCCARFGPPTYEQLAGALGSSVWQVSHVGGHRLAANVVTLPHGIYYGRVDPLGEAQAAFVAALRSGQIDLDRYRGRACYAKPVQAADYFVRRASGLTAWDALRLIEAERTADQHWRVGFEQASGGVRHLVYLHPVVADYRSYMSCGDAEPESVTRFELDEHSVYPIS